MLRFRIIDIWSGGDIIDFISIQTISKTYKYKDHCSS